MNTMLHKVNTSEELRRLPIRSDETTGRDVSAPVLATPAIAATVGAVSAVADVVGATYAFAKAVGG
ncbi:hypothetical protein HXP44_17225 [Streptomyces sioyaensis]|uniref:Uncharacterized protein n=1 Tax=Streptomyces sioyaensis TaxID=67364 RepID=A0A4Q1RBT2_9ACTN|nr:hypothetical protein [Streptomyces sioyaensis]MBM4793761.1 hypothetical protein [Streptomyces sioyaensis]RXS70908.1 hypothetical protein EST54_01925 [Streptomyces sioyaensis]